MKKLSGFFVVFLFACWLSEPCLAQSASGPESSAINSLINIELQLRDLKKQIRDYQLLIDNLKSQIATLKNNLTQEKESLATLQQLLTDSEALQAELNKRSTELLKQYDACERSLKQTRGEVVLWQVLTGAIVLVGGAALLTKCAGLW